MADERPLVPVAAEDKVALWTEVRRRKAGGALLSALPILERLCAAWPDDPRFFLCSAEALMQAGRSEEAAARLERAIRLNPQDERCRSLSAQLTGGRPRSRRRAARPA